jgi:hypothetical protein
VVAAFGKNEYVDHSHGNEIRLRRTNESGGLSASAFTIESRITLRDYDYRTNQALGSADFSP